METTSGVSRVCFSVPGDPQGWQRSGQAVRKNRAGSYYVHNYTKKETRAYEELVGLYARSHLPSQPWDGPVRLDIDIYVDRPQRLLKRSSPRGVIWCTNKPDRDNVEKGVLDGLTKVGLWLDDKQVCDGTVRKFYVAIGSNPGLVITATRLNEPTQIELPGAAT